MPSIPQLSSPSVNLYDVRYLVPGPNSSWDLRGCLFISGVSLDEARSEARRYISKGWVVVAQITVAHSSVVVEVVR